MKRVSLLSQKPTHLYRKLLAKKQELCLLNWYETIACMGHYWRKIFTGLLLNQQTKFYGRYLNWEILRFRWTNEMIYRC